MKEEGRSGVTRKKRSYLLFVSVLLLVPASTSGQNKLTAAQAKDHLGENATVCGTVASTRYATKSRGTPTFLNLDEPYPKEIFTIVIWGSDRSKCGDPEAKYASKKVCARGLIKSYRGVPEIEANEPAQIEMQK